MSNHYRAVIYDRAGHDPEVIEHFHKLLAKSPNALRGHRENLWASEQTYLVKLVERNAVLDKLAYTATTQSSTTSSSAPITGQASMASPPC